MLFSRWLRRSRQTPSTYRPTIDVLEDRTVPALLRLFPTAPVSPPATHLHVILPDHVETGKAFSVVIRAEDAANHVVTGFRGATQVSLSTADAGAAFPASFTFSAADQGKHTIQMTLTVTGTQTVKAASGTRQGQANVIVDPAVTHFGLQYFGTATVGNPTMVNVVALDANNIPVLGYTGTVHFSSTDTFAALPSNYKFTATDGGAHLFAVTFASIGKFTLAANDAANGSIIGGVPVKVGMSWLYSTWYNPYSSYGYGYGSGYGYPWY